MTERGMMKINEQELYEIITWILAMAHCDNTIQEMHSKILEKYDNEKPLDRSKKTCNQQGNNI
jgi:hypothetical protein